MRCEPWMNIKPVAPPSPKERAENDLRYWQAEQLTATARLNECTKQIAAAIAVIQNNE